MGKKTMSNERDVRRTPMTRSISFLLILIC